MVNLNTKLSHTQNAMRNILSDQDAEIVKRLLNSQNQISSEELSDALGIGFNETETTRQSLIKKCMTVLYSLDLEKYGWRRITLLITTRGGKTVAVGKKLLELNQVSRVSRTIGEVTIDLTAIAFVRSRIELADLIEDVKSMDGVDDLMWTEVVEVVGTKNAPPQLDTHEATIPRQQ